MENPTLSQGARLTAVRLRNETGEEVGKVVEWMMDVQKGNVVYVIAELNDTGKYYAVPWQLMTADLKGGGYIIDREKVQQSNMEVDRISLNTLVNDKEFLNKVFQAYGIAGESAAGSRQAAEPSSTQRDHPHDPSYPSNAEMSEGKGYG
jgi:hypothetical protein